MNPAPHADRDHSEWTPDRLANLRDAITPSTDQAPNDPVRVGTSPNPPTPEPCPDCGEVDECREGCVATW